MWTIPLIVSRAIESKEDTHRDLRPNLVQHWYVHMAVEGGLGRAQTCKKVSWTQKNGENMRSCSHVVGNESPRKTNISVTNPAMLHLWRYWGDIWFIMLSEQYT